MEAVRHAFALILGPALFLGSQTEALQHLLPPNVRPYAGLIAAVLGGLVAWLKESPLKAAQ